MMYTVGQCRKKNLLQLTDIHEMGAFFLLTNGSGLPWRVKIKKSYIHTDELPYCVLVGLHVNSHTLLFSC